MNDDERKVRDATLESINRLANAIHKFGEACAEASRPLEAMGYQFNAHREWPEVIYEDILDAETIEY